MSLGAGLGRDVEAHLGEHLEVEGGRHRHLGGHDAGEALDGPADLEQRHRVGVRAPAELDVVRVMRPLRRSRCQGAAGAGQQPGAGGVPDRGAGRRRGRGLVVGAERGDVRRELGQHLAVHRAVEQGRREQRRARQAPPDRLRRPRGWRPRRRGGPRASRRARRRRSGVSPPPRPTSRARAGVGRGRSRSAGQPWLTWARRGRAAARRGTATSTTRPTSSGRRRRAVPRRGGSRRRAPRAADVGAASRSAHGTAAAAAPTTPTHRPADVEVDACGPRWRTSTGAVRRAASRSRTRGGALTGITSRR